MRSLGSHAVVEPIMIEYFERGSTIKLSVRRACWIIVFALSLQAVEHAWGAPPRAMEKSDASDHQGTANAHVGVPPIIDWSQEVSLPDDLLFVDHQNGKKNALIFLVSLGQDGKVVQLRPISGFSLYLNAIAPQIKAFAFAPTLAGKTFILRIQDPLQKLFDNWKLYGSEGCSSATDLQKLYRIGELRLRHADYDSAPDCYKYILDRNPSSVAAQYGFARICMASNHRCALSYLESVIASNPEFIEARQSLASARSKSDGEAVYPAALDEILKLNLPLAQRLWLLDSQASSLNRLDKIEDAIRVIKQWNTAASELLAIYPPAVMTYDVQARHFGLLEEGKGLNDDAIATYRLASSMIALDPLASDHARYEADLGLARTSRKAGHAGEAEDLCNKWKKRWKKLVSSPTRRPSELRQDGAGELGGRWEFSCGSPEKGLALIEDTIKQFPDSNAPYTALSQYYYSIGDIDKAREAEATASRLLEAWGKKLGQF